MTDLETKMQARIDQLEATILDLHNKLENNDLIPSGEHVAIANRAAASILRERMGMRLMAP